MSDQVAQYLLRSFADQSRVSADVLLAAHFYAEKSQGMPATGVNEDLEKLLAEEEFSDDVSQQIRQAVIGFAVKTENVDLFAAAVGVLRIFRDPKAVSLLTAWLDGHLRQMLLHNRALSQLLHALQDSGAPIPFRQSSGIDGVESNIDTARKYLVETLGIQYSW